MPACSGEADDHAKDRPAEVISGFSTLSASRTVDPDKKMASNNTVSRTLCIELLPALAVGRVSGLLRNTQSISNRASLLSADDLKPAKERENAVFFLRSEKVERSKKTERDGAN